jgi:hypothetical protein
MLNVFFPELREIDRFYWKLTQEVWIRNPTARMVFITDKNEKKSRIKKIVRWTFERPPNAVFDELGITIERRASNKAHAGGRSHLSL